MTVISAWFILYRDQIPIVSFTDITVRKSFFACKANI